MGSAKAAVSGERGSHPYTAPAGAGSMGNEESTEALWGAEVEMFLKKGIFDINLEGCCEEGVEIEGEERGGRYRGIGRLRL